MGDASHVELLEPLLLKRGAEFRPEPGKRQTSFIQLDLDFCYSAGSWVRSRANFVHERRRALQNPPKLKSNKDFVVSFTMKKVTSG